MTRLNVPTNPEEMVLPSKSYPKITPNAEGADLTDPASDGGDDSVYVARSLLCSADCLAKLMEPGGIIRENVELQKGYNPIEAKRVYSVSTGTIRGLK